MTNSKTILLILLMCTASLAGCIGSESDDEDEGETLTIAYYLADDSESNAQAQGMADRLSADRGIDVELYDVSSEGMIIQALRYGNADIAS